MGRFVVGAAVSTLMVVGSIYLANLVFTRVAGTRPVGDWGAK